MPQLTWYYLYFNFVRHRTLLDITTLKLTTVDFDILYPKGLHCARISPVLYVCKFVISSFDFRNKRSLGAWDGVFENCHSSVHWKGWRGLKDRGKCFHSMLINKLLNWHLQCGGGVGEYKSARTPRTRQTFLEITLRIVPAVLGFPVL